MGPITRNVLISAQTEDRPASMARLRLAWKRMMIRGTTMLDRDACAERDIARRYQSCWCDSVERRLIDEIVGRRTSL